MQNYRQKVRKVLLCKEPFYSFAIKEDMPRMSLWYILLFLIESDVIICFLKVMLLCGSCSVCYDGVGRSDWLYSLV